MLKKHDTYLLNAEHKGVTKMEGGEKTWKINEKLLKAVKNKSLLNAEQFVICCTSSMTTKQHQKEKGKCEN